MRDHHVVRPSYLSKPGLDYCFGLGIQAEVASQESTKGASFKGPGQFARQRLETADHRQAEHL